MNTETDVAPQSPERLRAFVRFFKGYMSLSSLVTAALPIPVTAFKLIPTYRAQTGILSVYTSLFCFLILGFIFYSRHRLARLMFPEYLDRRPSGRAGMGRTRAARAFIRYLPFLLILLSIGFVFTYQNYWTQSVSQRRVDIAVWAYYIAPSAEPAGQPPRTNPQPDEATKKYQQENVQDKEVLETKDGFIPYETLLMVLYMGIFVTAEASFILMAIKEYLQDLVGLTEKNLITGPGTPTVHQ